VEKRLFAVWTSWNWENIVCDGDCRQERKKGGEITFETEKKAQASWD
jgi:hypothetical protein